MVDFLLYSFVFICFELVSGVQRCMASTAFSGLRLAASALQAAHWPQCVMVLLDFLWKHCAGSNAWLAMSAGTRASSQLFFASGGIHGGSSLSKLMQK
eukprot:6165960-Amphidinium_carterae.5